MFQVSGCGLITVLWTTPTGKRGCQSQNHVWTSILTVDSGVQTAAADTGLTSAKQPKVNLICCYVAYSGFNLIHQSPYLNISLFSVITPTEKPPSVGKLFN